MKLRLILLAPVLAVVISCGTSASSKPKDNVTKPAVEGPKLIGRIASIPADKRFVLIQSYGASKIEIGQILTTRGPEDRTANLRTTGESIGEFSAADLQAGSVEVGDAVYIQPSGQLGKLNFSPEVAQPQEATISEEKSKNN